MVAYLKAKTATCVPKTVSCLATRLSDFGWFLTRTDPHLTRLAELDRRRHIEPYLSGLVDAANTKTGQLITVTERHRRALAVNNFLSDIADWGWDEAPARRLIFGSDYPRLPRPLPRYLPVDADRLLTQSLQTSPHTVAASALLLARGCGLRIGELLDLELDCVHEIGGQGSWLKVPLGKLDTERMVPLDDETVELIDRVTEIRSPGRPLPHPRTGKPAQFLFTRQGRRLSQNAVRAELDRAAADAGLDHVTPHQLRHTYATALVNAGVSLQSLMALLGHVSAQMSLRYGKLFDATVRTEYERALTLAKDHIAILPTGPTTKNLPLTDISGGGDWKDTPTIKSRLAGGFCLRAPAQGACVYANICEHCPNFRTDTTYLPVLAAQRTDTQVNRPRFLAALLLAAPGGASDEVSPSGGCWSGACAELFKGDQAVAVRARAAGAEAGGEGVAVRAALLTEVAGVAVRAGVDGAGAPGSRWGWCSGRGGHWDGVAAPVGGLPAGLVAVCLPSPGGGQGCLAGQALSR